MLEDTVKELSRLNQILLNTSLLVGRHEVFHRGTLQVWWLGLFGAFLGFF